MLKIAKNLSAMLLFSLMLFFAFNIQTTTAVSNCNRYAASGRGYKGSGSINNPWTIKEAFLEAKPGDVVCFRRGIYSPDNKDDLLYIRISGTTDKKITFKNYPGETPIIDGTILGDYGTPPDNVTHFGQSYAGVKIEGDNIVFSGFEVRNFHYTNGIYNSGYGDIIESCFVHNNGDNYIRRSGKCCMDYNGSGINPWNDVIIRNNIIWANGYVGYEHGIYGHQDEKCKDKTMIVERNIFGFNAGADIRVSYIYHLKVAHNVVFSIPESIGFAPTNRANNMDVNNNIFIGGKIGIAKYSSDEKHIDFSHNLFYGQTEAAFVNVAPAPDTVYGDPKFVDPPKNKDDLDFDLHLRADSPAIDAGKYLGESYFGSAPDIGIYEYESSSTPSINPDINNDNKIDVRDLGILLSNWGKTDKGRYDINQDGRTDNEDATILLPAI